VDVIHGGRRDVLFRIGGVSTVGFQPRLDIAMDGWNVGLNAVRSVSRGITRVRNSGGRIFRAAHAQKKKKKKKNFFLCGMSGRGIMWGYQCSMMACVPYVSSSKYIRRQERQRGERAATAKKVVMAGWHGGGRKAAK